MSAALFDCREDGGTFETCSGGRDGTWLGFLSTALVFVVGSGTVW